MDTHSSDLQLRRAKVSDLIEASKIEVLSFGEEGALSRLVLRQYLDIAGPAFVVAEDPSKVVGFAVGATTVGNRENGWLLSVAVQPSSRGKGIAIRLVEYTVERLGDIGVQQVLATVSPSNKASIGMLSRVGFSTIDESENYFGDGHPRLIMARNTEGNSND